MKSEIEKLIQATVAIQCSNTLYAVIGRYGDRIPQDIQDEIRATAEEFSKNYVKIKNRVSKQLYTPQK